MKEYIGSSLTPAQVKEGNARMLEWLDSSSGDQGAVKAAEASTDYIRTRVREGSIFRQILPPQPVGKEDLQASLTDDDPRYFGEIEPQTPGGIVQPLGGRPNAWYFFGQRYEARFARLQTPRFMKDVAQLLTYKMDLRQVLSDMSLKDLLSLEDTRSIQVVNNMLAPAQAAAGGPLAAGDTVAATGNIQWRTINAGVTRTSMNDALSIMLNSNMGLRPSTCLINLHFALQIQKWDRTEFGGDIAQEVALKGFTERELFGCRFLITIKNWLVPNGTMYMFAPSEFIGKTLVLEDSTMHVKKDAFMVYFWSYQQVAQIWANIAGVCRADFSGVAAT